MHGCICRLDMIKVRNEYVCTYAYDCTCIHGLTWASVSRQPSLCVCLSLSSCPWSSTRPLSPEKSILSCSLCSALSPLSLIFHISVSLISFYHAPSIPDLYALIISLCAPHLFLEILAFSSPFSKSFQLVFRQTLF